MPQDEILTKVLSKRDRIAALPDSIRGAIIDRLFDKTIGPRIPKTFSDEQKGQVRKNFENAILGRSPEMFSTAPSEADYKRAGLPTGAGGKVQEGVMGGLVNLAKFLEMFDSEKDERELAAQRGEKRPEYYKVRPELSEVLADPKNVLAESTAAYSGRHPFKAGVAEFGGQMLPATAAEMLIPGTPPGLGLAPKVLAGAAKGGAGMIPFDPSPKGVATGAVFGGGLPIVSKAAGKAKAALVGSKAATKIAPAATSAVAGVAEGSEAKLEALAQKSFGKSLRELSPDQKIELVNKWRDESVAAAKTEKAAARKAAEQAKVDAVTKKATEKIDQRIATRKAMDEAKALQKKISEFIKTNKRAPNEEELLKMKSEPAVSAPLSTPASAGEARGAGLAARGDKGSVVPERGKAFATSEQVERRALPRSTRAQLYTSELSQIRKDIAAAATPEEKLYQEQRLAVKMDEYKKAMETPLADQFKAESPEAIKAVSAVADVSKITEQIKPKVTEVQVIPEGQHGAGTLGKRAKDAERVAKARELAKATQPEPATAETPESALLAKEEEFMNLTDQIEALGPKGKEAAKNLDKFRRKGTITMDQAIEMGNKVLEAFQKGTVPVK
jgi:hypothetical protein